MKDTSWHVSSQPCCEKVRLRFSKAPHPQLQQILFVWNNLIICKVACQSASSGRWHESTFVATTWTITSATMTDAGFLRPVGGEIGTDEAWPKIYISAQIRNVTTIPTDAAYSTVYVLACIDLTSTGKYTGGSAATLAQSCTQMWRCRVTLIWAWPFIISPGNSTGTWRSVLHRLKLVNKAW